MNTIRPTRYPDLGYMEHGGIWRIVTTEDGAAVGPQYATKAELLADLDRYAAEYLGNPDPRDARIRELEGALAGLFEHCAMVNRYWGNGSNAKQSDAAIEHARRILAEGSVKP